MAKAPQPTLRVQGQIAKAGLPIENKEKGVEESPVLALLSNGSSGRWSVTLDESTKDMEEWFLQIEGPSLHLFCELEDPGILNQFLKVLKTPSPQVFVIGCVNRIPLRVQWDMEDENTLFFTVGPASRPLVRCSIHGADIRALTEAIQQAVDDL